MVYTAAFYFVNIYKFNMHWLYKLIVYSIQHSVQISLWPACSLWLSFSSVVEIQLLFWWKFHWSLFLKVQLAITQHWFREWLGAGQATSHCLKQWWQVYWRIYASLDLNGLTTKTSVGILNTGTSISRVKFLTSSLLRNQLKPQSLIFGRIGRLSNVINFLSERVSRYQQHMGQVYCIWWSFKSVPTGNNITDLGIERWSKQNA